MCHGDDDGLRVPPRVAHVQAVVLVVRDDERAWPTRPAGSPPSCTAAGIRTRVDDQTATGFGRRVTDWELKGVPVRVEIGPRDLAEGVVTARAARRRGPRSPCPPPASRPTVGRAAGRDPGRPAGRGRGLPRRPHGDRGDHRGRRSRPGGPGSRASRGRRSATRARTGSPSTGSRCAACSAPTAACPTTSRGPSRRSSPAPTERRPRPRRRAGSAPRRTPRPSR